VPNPGPSARAKDQRWPDIDERAGHATDMSLDDFDLETLAAALQIDQIYQRPCQPSYAFLSDFSESR
jgi:hypothetical protein